MAQTSANRPPERWPEDAPFFEAEASLERAGQIEALLRLYEGRIRELPVPAEAAPLLTRAGQLAKDRLKDEARAEELFRRALLFDPQSEEAFEGLRGVLERKHDYDSLAQLLERFAQNALGARRATLLLQAADVYEQKLQRPDRAVFCLIYACRSDPTAREAFSRCRNAYFSEQRYRAVFESLERERAAAFSPALAEDYEALAEQLVDDPSEHSLAQAAASRALEIQPGHPGAEKVQKTIQQFEQTWRDRVRVLRTASLEERNRKKAARRSLQVAKVLAWYDLHARSKVREALERSFLLWPAMPEALAFLERLAIRERDLPDAVAWIQRMAEQANERSVQADLWARVATLRISHLQDRPGALEALEKVTQLDPRRSDAIAQAAELWIDNGSPERAVEAYEKHLSTLTQRSAQVEVRLWIAELCTALKMTDRARVHLEVALKLDPTDARAAYRLAWLCVLAGDLGSLEPILQTALCAPRPLQERVTLAEAAAKLCEQGGNFRLAFASLAQVSLVAQDPQLGAERLLRQLPIAGSGSELAAAIRRAARIAPEPASTRLWRGLAELLQSTAADPKGALAAWGEVLIRAPDDAGAATSVEQLRAASAVSAKNGNGAQAPAVAPPASSPARFELAAHQEDFAQLSRFAQQSISQSRWKDAAAAIEGLIALTSDPAERDQRQLELANLYLERLSRDQDAAVLLLDLLRRRSLPADAIAALERLASQGMRVAEICAALAEHYAKAGDYQRQAAWLLSQLAAVADPHQQKELLAQIAGIHERHLADSRAAFDFLMRALTVEPSDGSLQVDAARLARDLDAQVDLARFWLNLIAHLPDAPLATELLKVAADLATEAGATQELEASLKAALERSPDDRNVLTRLVELYFRSRRFAECENALRNRVAVAEGPEKPELYLRLAEVCAELSRPSDAAQAIQDAIQAGADESKHLPRVCDLLERAGRMSDLSEALRRCIELASSGNDSDGAARFSLRRAKLLESSSKHSDAVKGYAEMLTRRPSDPEALAALEALLKDPKCREQAAHALIPAYEAVKDHRKLVAVLDVVSEMAQDGLEKVLALKQAAHIYSHQLRQPELAFAALARALRLAPGDAATCKAARKAAEDADALDSFAEVLSEILEEEPGAEGYALHRELADLYERNLNDRQAGIRHLRAALALQPKNPEVLRALRQLYRSGEEWAGLAEVAETLAEVVPDAGQKIEFWREAALAWEQKLNDHQRAAAAYRQIAKRNPLDVQASLALERLYGSLDRPEDLAFALNLRLVQESQSPMGREVAFRLAQLRQHKLADAPGALQLYRQILEEDASHAETRAALEKWARQATPEAVTALELLDPVLARSGDHLRRIELREARMEGAPSQEKSRMSSEVREIWERDLGRPEPALKEALKAFEEGLDREKIQPELERLARVTGAYEQIAQLYQRVADTLIPGDQAIVRLLRRAGELREQLSQNDLAIAAWKALLEEQPQDLQALDHLTELYQRSNDVLNLAAILARKAQLTDDPEHRFQLLLRAGEAFELAGEDVSATGSFHSSLAIRKNLEALSALDRLHGKAGRWAEQGDVLDLLVEVSSEDVDKKAYLVRRAELLETNGQTAPALSAYARALSLFPRDSESVAGLERLVACDPVKHDAARLLEPIYRALNEVQKLAAVLELRAEAATGEERQKLLGELATLREHLGEKSLAFVARANAFRDSPENQQSREEFERLAAETGSFQELAEAYQEQLRRGTSEPLALELWRSLANLYAGRLDRPELSIRAYEEVCKREGDGPAALEALARLHRQAGSFENLGAVIKRQVALEAAVPKKLNLLFELGRVAEEALSDRALAVQCYREILELQPDDPNAIKLLERVFSQTEQWQELASLFEREAQLAEARGAREETFDLKVRGARVRLSRLEDPRGALDAFQEILQVRPGHPGAVAGLDEMARSNSPLRGEAAAALEPLFAASGDYFRLLQMLEARASVESVPHNRVALLRRITELYAGPMKNPEMAFVEATRALRELPDDEASLHLCLRLVEAADAIEDLSALLAEVIPKASTEAARASMYRALARLQARQKLLEQAATSWTRVLEIYPANEEALDAIGRLYAIMGKARELLDVLRRQLAAAQTLDRRALLLLQIGTLQFEHLNDRLGALATFRSWSELNPADPTPLEQIELITDQLQRWPELADALTKRLKLQGETADQALKFRLAHLRELRLMDQQGALELYSEILAAQPDHSGTVSRLQEMVQRDPENEPAVNMLLKALRVKRDTPALAATLELRVGVSGDLSERKSLLLELAGLRKQLNEPELVYQALSRAFKEDPNDRELRPQLELAAETAGTHEHLANAYQEQLPRLSVPAEAAEVCLTTALLLEQKLKDPNRAVLLYEKARQLDPSARPKALPALDRLYTELGKSDELAGVLEALADDATEPQQEIGFLFRLGRLAEESLQAPERATATYQRILQVDKAHLGAVRRLEQLYEAQGNIDRLYSTLRLGRDLASGAERERIMVKMARISAEDLSDIGESIELYRELLGKNPQNDRAYEALEELYEKAERLEDLRELLAGRVQQSTEPRELVRANEKLGRIHQRLGQKEEAIPFFRAALERDPRHRPALESLREIYEELGRKEELIAVLRRLITLEETAGSSKALRIRLAEVLAETRRKEEALEAGRRALEIEPHQPAELNRLHQVFLDLKAFGDAVQALEVRSSVELSAGERDQAITTLFAVADLWCGDGHKPESAGSALLKILELDSANRAAYERARELYGQLGDWRSQGELIDRFLPQVVTEEEKLALLRELAEVREHKLGQKHAAFMAICRAVQLNAAEDTLRSEAERLAEETGSLEDLVAVYEEIGETLPHGPLSEKLYLDLARVQEQKLDNLEAAEKSLRKILDFEPTNALALNALAEMFARHGRDREYAAALEHKLEAIQSVDEQKRLMRELARLHEERLEDPAGAAKVLLRSLDLEPDPETAALLVAVYRRQKAWPEAVRALDRVRDLAASPEERARLQVEIAQLYERELNDDLRATEAYQAALKLEPANRAAIDALELLYTKLDRPEELLAIYDRQLDLSSDYRDKVKLFFKSAWIWEDTLQNLSNSAACIEGVLSLDPQNLQAIKQLERLRRAEGRWEELAAVLERHVQLCTSPEEQSELCVEIGDIQQQHLKHVDRAPKLYDRALELNPRNLSAIHALGTLYERSGNWPFALEILQREIEVIGARPEAAQLHHRMGKINQDMLLEVPIAKACYLEALRIAPGHLPTLAALKEIYANEGEWDSYQKTLVDEAQYTEAPELKSLAFTEVANYFAEKKEDLEAAAHWYEEALKLVPNSFDPARKLADIYVGRQNWDSSERMLDIVSAQMSEQLAAAPGDALAHEVCRQFYRLGYVTEKLGNKDKALSAYEKAYRLDATYLPSLEGLGNLLVQANRLDEALNVYQAILIHHREDLTDLEVVEIYWQLGEIHSGLKQMDRAQNHYEKALALDPSHEPSLRALVALADAGGRFDKSAAYRQSLIKVLDGDAKLEVCIELGRLAREKLSDPHTAIDAYLAAHRLQPESVSVMDSLYVLYRETKQGQKAAEMLEKMLGHSVVRQDPQRAKRVYFALGEISRDELGDPQRAVTAFNAALDLDHRFLEAFSAAESLLGGQKQWKQLEENYVRMIQRQPKTDETHAPRMALWRALGELYLQVLKNSESALMAYQVAAAGLPDDAAVQETYAELLALKPGEEAKAIAAYRKALPRTSHPAKVVSALAELAARRKDYDSAYLAAQVAQGLLGEAGPGEREILTKLGPYARKKEIAQQPLTDRLWKTHLFHPKVRGSVGELMAIVYQQVGHLYAVALSQYQVNPKKHRIDVPSAQEYQLHHYRYVARLLGMEAVELYSPFLVATRERLRKRSGDPVPEPLGAIEICHTHPVCLKVGGKFFSERSQKEIYYLIGRTLALLRPELALAHWLSPARLEAILQAALSLSGERFRITADPRAIEAERSLLQRALTEPARVALDRAAREYIRLSGNADLTDYLDGAELTATRAGLFVAGEIEPVKRVVVGEVGPAYRVNSEAKLRELMVFATSEDLHELRAAVGIQVEVQLRK